LIFLLHGSKLQAKQIFFDRHIGGVVENQRLEFKFRMSMIIKKEILAYVSIWASPVASSSTDLEFQILIIAKPGTANFVRLQDNTRS
jgi:hypothetical protein